MNIIGALLVVALGIVLVAAALFFAGLHGVALAMATNAVFDWSVNLTAVFWTWIIAVILISFVKSAFGGGSGDE